MASLSLLAPFQIRSFRFQWPADLLTSWGFEMENVILGWYVLVATGSVVLLTAFASIQYLGTLFAPVIGMAGDRIGHRNVLCAMRATYAGLAAVLMTFAFSGHLSPATVFAVAAVSGMIRSSDLAMRNALVAETMPPDRFTAAVGAARTTSDSARVVGSLAGAGLFAAVGMGYAYLAITCFYLVGFLLTLGVGAPRAQHAAIETVPASMWRDLRDGLSFVWDTPCSLAAMWLAFLVNLTAFPLTSGLLPYVARDIYHIDQTGLGLLVASFAIGALIGSIAISIASRLIRPARMMIVFAMAWYMMLLVFVRMPTLAGGSAMLVLAGFAQSLSMVPMAVMLLHSAGPRFRGRVMGVRMFAIYGLPLGLLPAGALIDRFALAPTVTLYCCIGLAATLAIALRWRADLWPLLAPANRQ
jgi:predicted MFS family arabinose efflux permease